MPSRGSSAHNSGRPSTPTGNPARNSRAAPGRHEQPGRPGTRCQPGGEQAISDADLASEAAPANGLGKFPGQLGLAAEVARRAAYRDRADSRPQDLDLRAELLDDGDHRLEGTRCRTVQPLRRLV